jgi:hypothetical protein
MIVAWWILDAELWTVGAELLVILWNTDGAFVVILVILFIIVGATDGELEIDGVEVVTTMDGDIVGTMEGLIVVVVVVGVFVDGATETVVGFKVVGCGVVGLIVGCAAVGTLVVVCVVGDFVLETIVGWGVVGTKVGCWVVVGCKLVVGTNVGCDVTLVFLVGNAVGVLVGLIVTGDLVFLGFLVGLVGVVGGTTRTGDVVGSEVAGGDDCACFCTSTNTNIIMMVNKNWKEYIFFK